MQTTPYLLTPYPEALPDLADIPKNLRDIATSWENAFAGAWIDWNPVVTQSAGGEQYAMVFDLTNSVRRVRKVGRTVFVLAHLIVTTGTGQSGYPQIFLPYPMADINICAGTIVWKQSTTTGACGAIKSSYTPNLNNVSVVEAFGNSTARAANDTFDLLLRYETV